MTTYVVFDGDNDGYAYLLMKAWKAHGKIEFEFQDAHDLDNMGSRAQNEAYVKAHLKPRMEKSTAVLVLVGESTRYLYKYIRWELELALELGKPIIVVNLNKKRERDYNLCPPIIRDECAIHISYERDIMRYAMNVWPGAYAGLSVAEKGKGARHYSAETYKSLETK